MGVHQIHQGNQVYGRHSLAATLLLLLTLFFGSSGRLTGMICPQENQKLTGASGLHHLHNSVIDRVLVLLQPASHIVGYDTSVVGDSKVSVLVSLGLRCQEDRQLSERGLQLLLKGLISCLREKRLLLEDGPDTHRFLKHDDGSSQVHTEVHHDPVNAFLDVLLLFNNEHVVVEELDGDLFESVVLKDLESGNIEHSTEVCLLEGVINKGIVTFVDEPLEDTVKDCPGNTSSSHSSLLTGLTLDHPLSSDLDPRLAEGLEESRSLYSERCSSLSSKGLYSNVSDLSLVITT